MVFAFGSSSKVQVEHGSHRRTKTRLPLKDDNSTRRRKATIELDPSCVKGLVETIDLADGGRLIMDPRLNFCILEGDGMMYTYRRSVMDRPPMRFPAELEEVIKDLETETFKIHTQIGKRVQPGAPEAG